ncbi:hypothetical protein [Desulfonema magnum]|uniref:Uncharacterized protein n=1 Tax=Desulfonema magnum TaxID=45655 RepID=A0A975BW32_9BACT|nr:hypothetical protein [Desulfonema magnum]QTA92723.1 Uncharacterized protein dnm_088120 [Desulfonema magnum]
MRHCVSYEHCYEDNPKHGLKSRGNIARRPTNGDSALENSVPISERRRLGYDAINMELVVLPLHRTDEENCVRYYHGFVIDDPDQLRKRQDIINTAKKAGYPLPKKQTRR